MKICIESKGQNLVSGYDNKKMNKDKQSSDGKQMLQKKPPQVDISKEGMEKYRTILEQSRPEKTEIKECHVLIDYGWELSRKENQINDSKKDTTIEGRANSLLESYASVYNDIVQGYKDGTRVVYADSGEDRILTKEEDLARLNDAYKNHVDFFEERISIDKKNNEMLENSIKGHAWERTSARARGFLEEQERKRDNPEYVPANLGERMREAGKQFVEQFATLKEVNNKSISKILSSIKLFR